MESNNKLQVRACSLFQDWLYIIIKFYSYSEETLSQQLIQFESLIKKKRGFMYMHTNMIHYIDTTSLK